MTCIDSIHAKQERHIQRISMSFLRAYALPSLPCAWQRLNMAYIARCLLLLASRNQYKWQFLLFSETGSICGLCIP